VLTKQCFSENILNDLAYKINGISWHVMYLMDDCQDQADVFYDHISARVEKTLPTCTVKVSSADRPWITPYFKALITRRGIAFAAGDLALYRSLGNRVNTDIQYVRV